MDSCILDAEDGRLRCNKNTNTSPSQFMQLRLLHLSHLISYLRWLGKDMHFFFFFFFFCNSYSWIVTIQSLARPAELFIDRKCRSLQALLCWAHKHSYTAGKIMVWTDQGPSWSLQNNIVPKWIYLDWLKLLIGFWWSLCLQFYSTCK